MNSWITFWQWLYIIGLGSFFVLVLAIIPLGARDLMRLFRHLNRDKDTIHGEGERDG